MRTFRFEAGYYEWHLIDDMTGEVCHNLADPAEDLYREDGSPMSRTELTNFLADDLLCADRHYFDGEEYNGILLKRRLQPKEIHLIIFMYKLFQPFREKALLICF